MSRLIAAVATLAALAATTVEAATVIDTTSGWPDVSSSPLPDSGGYGYGQIASIGQTFTVTGSNTTLRDFSFWLETDNSTMTQRGYVFAWDGTKATGPALVETAPLSLTTAENQPQRVRFDVSVGLATGQQYVAFMSVSRHWYPGNGNSGSEWGWVTTNNYAGGNLVWSLNDDNVALWTTAPWTSYPQWEMGFRATLDDSLPLGSPLGVPMTVPALALLLPLILRRRS